MAVDLLKIDTPPVESNSDSFERMAKMLSDWRTNPPDDEYLMEAESWGSDACE